jgi:hypothetical protein
LDDTIFQFHWPFRSTNLRNDNGTHPKKKKNVGLNGSSSNTSGDRNKQPLTTDKYKKIPIEEAHASNK